MANDLRFLTFCTDDYIDGTAKIPVAYDPSDNSLKGADSPTPQVTLTANTALTLAHSRVVMDSGSARTLTLPDAQLAYNHLFEIVNAGAGTLTVQRAGTDILLGGGTSTTVATGHWLRVLGIKRADNSYVFATWGS